MTALRPALSAAFVAIAVATPRLASACAVCLGGEGGGTGQAFLIGTALLSILPLAVIGGAVWYLRRRAGAIEREQGERRALHGRSAVSGG